MAANPHRGEVAITLGGREYVARPSWSAVVQWESVTGRSTVEMLAEASRLAPRISDLVHVLHRALEAGGADLTAEQVYELINEDSVFNYFGPFASLLSGALTGGREVKAGNAERPVGQ